MKRVILLIVMLSILSCKNDKEAFVPRVISTVEIKTLMEDSLLNVRALEIDEHNNFGFATSKGEIGGHDLRWTSGTNDDSSTQFEESARISIQLKHDSIIPNFRSLAVTTKAGYLLSIGSPALLYKVSEDSIRVVYKEENPKAFYDAMDFWNDDEGIAIGDPTEDCMSIIVTRDGGESWTKLPCDVVPKTLEGEAAFAASDTNIAIVDDETWVATGGMSSRILYSPDKGESWQVFETPIVQGSETTGMYSIDFYDASNGFAIGGDYLKPEANTANKIRTDDGGQTWEVIGAGSEPGYRSCVQYIPNREGKELVVVGFKGIDYSNDAGTTWTHLSDEGFYTIRFVSETEAYAAGRGRIAKLAFSE